MKISTDNIKKTIEFFKKKGVDITVSDMSYIILNEAYESSGVAYTSLYGKGDDTSDKNSYFSSQKIRNLKEYMDSNFKFREVAISNTEEIKGKRGRPKKDDVKPDEDEGISFEENKKSIEKDIRYIEKFIKDNETTLDPKEIASLIGRKADLQSKLIDKFGAKDEKEQQLIIVNTKFNHICEWTHRECFIQTKEYAMQQWNLIENPNTK